MTEPAGRVANRVDPDQTPQKAASDLTLCAGFSVRTFKVNRITYISFHLYSQFWTDVILESNGILKCVRYNLIICYLT